MRFLHFPAVLKALHWGAILAVALAAHRLPVALLQVVSGVVRGVLGGFNRLLQHLNYGGVEWEDQRVGHNSRPGVLRCLRRGDLRSIRDASGGRSGSLFRQACRPGKQLGLLEFRSHSGRGSFAKQVKFHPRI